MKWDSLLTVFQGDCFEKLSEIPDNSIHCCVTSPPYWGLRDYGVDGQIGLESSIEDYLSKVVAVFREVRRVLKKDGTCWVNLGDSYAGSTQGGGLRDYVGGGKKRLSDQVAKQGHLKTPLPIGLKPKDLCGIPWRVAFALQQDGWYLRSDIIWSKPNPMPESVNDRPTKAHEYIFFLTKSKKYFYDAEAIKETASYNTHERQSRASLDHKSIPDERRNGIRPKSLKMPNGWDTGKGSHGSFHRNGREKGKTRKLADVGSGIKNNDSFDAAMSVMPEMRNKRSVWSVPTFAFPEAHFATYPPDLIKPCILAGCPVGGVVLDPFAGSGTTGQVALELGRKAILIELNPEYIKLIKKRCDVTPGFFMEV